VLAALDGWTSARAMAAAWWRRVRELIRAGHVRGGLDVTMRALFCGDVGGAGDAQGSWRDSYRGACASGNTPGPDVVSSNGKLNVQWCLFWQSRGQNLEVVTEFQPDRMTPYASARVRHAHDYVSPDHHAQVLFRLRIATVALRAVC
jgi:hypothetical protein